MFTASRVGLSTGEPIGEVLSASMMTGFRAESYGYSGRRAWLGRPEEGGSGQWLLNGIHDVAQLRYVFGEVTHIHMREHHAASADTPDVEGTMVGQLTVEAGFQVSILLSREVHVKGGLRGITIYGDRATYVRRCRATMCMEKMEPLSRSAGSNPNFRIMRRKWTRL